MTSRLLPLLVLSMTFSASACGDRTLTKSLAEGTESEQGSEAPTSEEMDTQGDGDPSGDAEASGEGDSSDDPSGDPTDEAPCIDLDQDGYGTMCDLGPDCDDNDHHNHSEEGCANCEDADVDGYWVGCDSFDQDRPGPDCNDDDFNVFSEGGCANCTDDDNDGHWIGCDQYSDQKPGPDCDDANPEVGDGDEVPELCNGLSEACGGVDDDPPEEMCAIHDAPNVASWACNPPAPGVDGCEILSCVEGYWDLDGEVANGCESEVPG